jgi:hypothetical protein
MQCMLTLGRNQGVLRVAHDTPALRREGVHWWLRYLMSMHQDGSLAKMLEEKNVVVPAEGEQK